MAALACILAAICGFCCFAALRQRAADSARRKQARRAMEPDSRDGLYSVGEGDSPVLRHMRRQARQPQPAWLRRTARARVWAAGLGDASGLIARAGLAGQVDLPDVCVARVQLTAGGALAGALAGAMLSAELALALGIAGALAGHACVPRALRGRVRRRSAQMERHLPEMLEVVLLGLQSGLSFERAFGLYPRYFPTELGRSMARAVRRWEAGLATREEALRGLEREYDSALLARVVGTMLRAVRFGSSVSDSLEAAARDAREAHRAHVEERVAKAAVKMMLPVGTLILPAMLLLVLGPVMLELVQGF